MIFIPPSYRCRGAHNVDATHLIASIKTDLTAEASRQMRSLFFRAIGDRVIIEGTVKSRRDVERIRRIAERAVGADHVFLRLSRVPSSA